MATRRIAAKRAESLEEMESAHLACRDKGHHWAFLNDKITATSGKRIREVSRWWQCKTCLTEQEEVFEVPACTIKFRRYHYPDGYLLAKGLLEGGRLAVADVRRQVFGRNGIHF